MDRICILHVDDDPQFSRMTARLLQAEHEAFDVVTEERAADALDRLDERAADVDCVVSNYLLPETNGIAFLEAVREEHPDLPFILFTGKGSEEIASDAVRAGATDYLQKSGGGEQYKLLANRIRNAVEQYHANRRAANLDRIRGIARNVNHLLVRATTRADAETRVCEAITDAEPYRLAWIGTVDPDTEHVEPRVAAGAELDYLDDLTVPIDDREAGRTPAGRAVRERRVVVSENIAEDPTLEPWQERAIDRGFHSLAVVPLAYEDALYGILVVYAEYPQPFDERERDLLAELGADVGRVFHSFDVQAQLREERDRRSALFENAPGPVVVARPRADGSEYVIRDVNDAFADVFGYDPDDVVGRGAADVLVPDERLDEYAKFRERVEAGEAVTTEVEHLTADGPREFVLHLVSFGAGDDVTGGVYAWYTDVTERAERER